MSWPAYQQNRVFLAGDAAHLNWPAGGFGMNTGIGDAVDIGWKLAAVLQGWGGPICSTATGGAQALAMINVNEAAEMRASFDHQAPFSPKIEEDSEEGNELREKARAAIMRTRAKEFQHDSAGIELGYRYGNSPICIADGTPPPPLDHGIMSVHLAGIARAACLAKGRSFHTRFIRQGICST